MRKMQKFKAKQGQFMRFKNRSSYHFIKKLGEQAAAEFLNPFKNVVEENGFLSEEHFRKKLDFVGKKFQDG